MVSCIKEAPLLLQDIFPKQTVTTIGAKSASLCNQMVYKGFPSALIHLVTYPVIRILKLSNFLAFKQNKSVLIFFFIAGAFFLLDLGWLYYI